MGLHLPVAVDCSFCVVKYMTKTKIAGKEIRLFNGNFTAVPNDLIDKGYIKLFNDKKSLSAVMDLIQQAYKAGLEAGRQEIIEEMTD